MREHQPALHAPTRDDGVRSLRRLKPPTSMLLPPPSPRGIAHRARLSGCVHHSPLPSLHKKQREKLRWPRSVAPPARVPCARTALISLSVSLRSSLLLCGRGGVCVAAGGRPGSVCVACTPNREGSALVKKEKKGNNDERRPPKKKRRKKEDGDVTVRCGAPTTGWLAVPLCGQTRRFSPFVHPRVSAPAVRRLPNSKNAEKDDNRQREAGRGTRQSRHVKKRNRERTNGTTGKGGDRTR